ncbi:capsular biosynthesis protein CpsH [Paenibacillus sp. FSL R7-0273]|uniref:phytoene desaturase family protein n=1 Tax=Paenibacillus sp. FSL R7-0273 TaxID=1536772 RepID=UPI0004F86982|nr:phytoene desaturase family protein [Paenibacillus sp. FSL R7-0273]AIQ49776.1 capsular biosynthesis protein CpsH [Paenibacillus sp. FSL R7-0273]OMF92355.1 phytoene desaturase [Paenibacillus sp. FSL R7-0273]
MSRVAIVGGGIGGLTAALLLSRQGQQVVIYERAGKVGGRVAFEEEGPYRIDQGPTIVLLPEMLNGILEEGGLPPGSLELLRCDPLCRIHFRSGRVLTKVAGLEEQAAEIEREFPGEGSGFLRFMGDMAGLFPRGKASFLEQPFHRRREFFSPANLRLMSRLRAYRSLRSAVGSYFRSEELRDAFSLQSLYIGGAPFRTPGIYTMLPYAESAFGIWMLKGGYGKLPQILSRELLSRGVEIHTGTEVETLTVEDGRCTGLTAGGVKHSYDAVLYNGEFPQLEGLLPAELFAGSTDPGNGAVKVSSGARGRIKRGRYKPSSGCVLIYAGADRRWPESQTHQFFLPDSLNDNLRELFDQDRVSELPSYYVFNPAALDDSAAPPGESALYFLIPVPADPGLDWEAIAEPLAQRVLDDAEQRGFPGLKASLRWKTIRTPADAQKDGLYGGGSFGIAPVLSQLGVFRPQPRPYPIKGLYAAGASVHPGGGVPIVMQGARMAVHELMKEMKQ